MDITQVLRQFLEDLPTVLSTLVRQYVDFDNWIVTRYPDLGWDKIYPTMGQVRFMGESPITMERKYELQRPYADAQMTIQQLYSTTYLAAYEETLAKITCIPDKFRHCPCNVGGGWPGTCLFQDKSEKERVEHIIFWHIGCKTCQDNQNTKVFDFDLINCDVQNDTFMSATICSQGHINVQRACAYYNTPPPSMQEYSHLRQIEHDLGLVVPIRPRTAELRAKILSLREDIALYTKEDTNMSDDEDVRPTQTLDNINVDQFVLT